MHCLEGSCQLLPGNMSFEGTACICQLNLQEYTFKFCYATGGQVGMGISLNGRGSSKGAADQVGRGLPSAQAVSFKA